MQQSLEWNVFLSWTVVRYSKFWINMVLWFWMCTGLKLFFCWKILHYQLLNDALYMAKQKKFVISFNILNNLCWHVLAHTYIYITRDSQIKSIYGQLKATLKLSWLLNTKYQYFKRADSTLLLKPNLYYIYIYRLKAQN